MARLADLIPAEERARYPLETLTPKARRILDRDIPDDLDPLSRGELTAKLVRKLPRMTIAANGPRLLAAHLDERSMDREAFARAPWPERMVEQFGEGVLGNLVTPGRKPLSSNVVPDPRSRSERIARAAGGGAAFALQAIPASMLMGPVAGTAAVMAGQGGTPKQRVIRGAVGALLSAGTGAISGAVRKATLAQAVRQAPAYQAAVRAAGGGAPEIAAAAGRAVGVAARRGQVAGAVAGAVGFGAVAPQAEFWLERLTGDKDATPPRLEDMIESTILLGAAHAPRLMGGRGKRAARVEPRAAPASAGDALPRLGPFPAPREPGPGAPPHAEVARDLRGRLSDDQMKVVMGIAKGSGKPGDPTGRLPDQAIPADRGRTGIQSYLERIRESLPAQGPVTNEQVHQAARDARRGVRGSMLVQDALQGPPAPNERAARVAKVSASEWMGVVGGKTVQIQGAGGPVVGRIEAIIMYPWDEQNRVRVVVSDPQTGAVAVAKYKTEGDLAQAVKAAPVPAVSPPAPIPSSKGAGAVTGGAAKPPEQARLKLEHSATRDQKKADAIAAAVAKQHPVLNPTVVRSGKSFVVEIDASAATATPPGSVVRPHVTGEAVAASSSAPVGAPAGSLTSQPGTSSAKVPTPTVPPPRETAVADLARQAMVDVPERRATPEAAVQRNASTEPGLRDYKTDERVSVPYQGRSTTRQREKATVIGYVDGQLHVRVKKGKTFEFRYIDETSARRLPKRRPLGAKAADDERRIAKKIGGDPMKAVALMAQLETELARVETLAAEIGTPDHRARVEFARLRAKWGKLRAEIDEVARLSAKLEDALGRVEPGDGAGDASFDFGNQRGSTPIFNDAAEAAIRRATGALRKLSELMAASEDVRADAGEILSRAGADLSALSKRYIVPAGILLRSLGGAGRTIAAGMDKAHDAMQGEVGKRVAEIQVRGGRQTAAQREVVGRALDSGEGGALPNTTRALRAMLKDTIENAKIVGLRKRTSQGRLAPIGELKAYFPQQVKRSLRRKLLKRGTLENQRQIAYMLERNPNLDRTFAQARLEGYVRAPNEIQHGNLQHERQVYIAPEYREWDYAKVLPNYMLGAWRRIEAARSFGPTYKILAALLDEIPNDGARKSAAMVVQGFTDPHMREMRGLAKFINDAMVVSLLSTAGIVQPVQGGNTAARFGYYKTLLGYAELFTREGREWALATGAAVQEMVQDVTKEGQGVAGLHVRLIGLEPLDRANRLAAALAGRLAANDWAAQLHENPGNKILRGRFAEAGFDPDKVAERGRLTDDELRRFARWASNDTQFASRPTDLPAGRNSSQGQFIYLFHSFAVQQFSLVGRLSDAARRGAAAPLLRYLAFMATAGAVAGEAVSFIREWITGHKRRMPKNAFWRYVQDIMYVGTLGILSDGVYALSQGPDRVTGLMLGVGVTESVKYASEGFDAILGRPRHLMRHAINRVPLLGPRLADWLVPARGKQGKPFFHKPE